MSSSSSSETVVVDATFQAESFDALEINVPAAHVELRPHDEEEIHLRGFVPDAEAEPARALFDRKGISTHQSGTKLHVFGNALSEDVGDWRGRRTHSTAVHFEVRLPPALDVTTELPGGSVDAAHLTGTLAVSVMGGTVETSDLEGPLHVRGSGASLAVADYGGPSLDLRWSAGPVTLRTIGDASITFRAASAPTTVENANGPLDLSVQGAPLTLHNVQGACEAEVRGGTLTYHGSPATDTNLRTVGGPLRTHLPPSQAATLTLAGARVGLDDTFAFEGERTTHRIEGTLNGGGPSLNFRAVQGAARCKVMEEA